MEIEYESEIEQVAQAILALDPDGSRTARVLRDTFDQLYDGQRTGRYRLDQLYKTEKTHCGTLVEINMQREFRFADGRKLDFFIADQQVDCKYSQSMGGWMIPIEAQGEICLVLTANDEKSTWSMGVVRTSVERLTKGGNRDKKKSISAAGREHILWLFRDADLPPNALLQLDSETIQRIMRAKSGQQRINQLFRLVLETRISGNVVATVAQQKDYMKRVRSNGGARGELRAEGIVILGQYNNHQLVAAELGLPIPEHGESVSVRLAPSGPNKGVEIAGAWWRLASPDDPSVMAPQIPNQ